MIEPKEKFLFDDDLLEEMCREKEIENRIQRPVILFAIFDPGGSIDLKSIARTERKSWDANFNIEAFDYDFEISLFIRLGYQCRQIQIKALKK